MQFPHLALTGLRKKVVVAAAAWLPAGLRWTKVASAADAAVAAGTRSAAGELLETLQLGQGNYVTVEWPVPDGRVAGHIVVVEASRVHVEQLPPLVVVAAFDFHALEGDFCSFQGISIKISILLTSGGSQTHSPVARFAYIKSRVRGSMISTHSMQFLEERRDKRLFMGGSRRRVIIGMRLGGKGRVARGGLELFRGE